MSRNGAGVYSLPAGTEAIPGQTIDSGDFNTLTQDLANDNNTARPVVAGGTGATNAADALANLGGQPVDATTTAFAALTFAANKGLYATGADAFATYDLTAGGRLVAATTFTDPNADRVFGWDDSAGAFIGFTLGTGLAFNGTAIELDADLQAWAGVNPSSYYTSSQVDTALALKANSSSLGTAAAKNTGTSGNNVPLLDGANTWSAVQAFTGMTLGNPSGWSTAGWGRPVTLTKGYGVLWPKGAGSLSWLAGVSGDDFYLLTSTADDTSAGVTTRIQLGSTTFAYNGNTVLTTANGAALSGASFSGSGIPVSVNSTNNTIPLALSYAGTAFGYFGLVGTNDHAIYSGSLAVYLRIGNTALEVLNNGTQSPDFRITQNPASLAENSAGFRGLPRRAQVTASYTLVLADAGQYLEVTMGSGSQTITIPPNSSVAYPLGTVVAIVAMTGGNNFTIVEGSGVTLRRGDGTAATGTRTMSGSGYQIVTLHKIDTNVWQITGAFT